MAFKPHVPTGTIWIVWGEDAQHLYKTEYTGKRTVRALKTKVIHTKKGGAYSKGDPDLYFAYLQYEGPDFPLMDTDAKELYSMGVITQNLTGEYMQKGIDAKGNGWTPGI
jgi:hypothetical protein